jgi:hypothetical protein
MVKLLTACPGAMRWLNCALAYSVLAAVIRSENYQRHHQVFVPAIFEFLCSLDILLDAYFKFNI